MTMLSVIIPALDEEDGIADIIERVLAVRPALVEVGVEDLELIVVDDGSIDRTAEIAASYKDVRLIKHSVNKGYGAAIKTGFSHAKGELLSFLDADGTYPPEHYPELCKPALEGADLVIGSRMTGSDSQMPRVRRIGNTFFATLVSLVSNVRITDSSSGQRVLRREILPTLYPLPDGLNFTPVMSTRAIHENLKMVEVPITYSERAGRSKLSVVRDGTRFLNSIIWTAMKYNPVRILGSVGLAMIALAGLVATILLAMRLQGITSLGPWGVFSFFVASVSLVAGVSIFALGTMFNYLVSLFHRSTIRQGLFGKPLFRTPLDRQFGWLGLLFLICGLVLSATGLILSLNGSDIARLWLWLLASAMVLVVGLQLVIFWFVMRILEELSRRDFLVEQDMNGQVTIDSVSPRSDQVSQGLKSTLPKGV